VIGDPPRLPLFTARGAIRNRLDLKNYLKYICIYAQFWQDQIYVLSESVIASGERFHELLCACTRTFFGAGIAQSVSLLGHGLDDPTVMSLFLSGVNGFLFFITSRQAAMPTQLPG
jgi:hypothetical protein